MSLNLLSPQHEQGHTLVLGKSESILDEAGVVDDSLRFESTAGGEDGFGLSVVDPLGELYVRRRAWSARLVRDWSDSKPAPSNSPFGAKPPKTTEWMAPIREHASMAIAPSSIIGICRELACQ